MLFFSSFFQTTGLPAPPSCVPNVTNLPAGGQFILIARSLESLSLIGGIFSINPPPVLYLWNLCLTDDLLHYIIIPHVSTSSYQGQATNQNFTTWMLQAGLDEWES